MPAIPAPSRMLLKLQSSASFAHRLIPSAAGIEAVFAHRAVQVAATVAALLALCWGLAQGTWRVVQPGSPAVARASGGCALVIVQGQPESAYCTGEDVVPGARLESVLRDRIVIVRGGAREAVLMKDAEETPGAAVAAMTPIVQQLGTDERVLVDVQRQGRSETLYYDMR